MPFVKIHPSHLITVVSETVLAGPSLLSSRWKANFAGHDDHQAKVDSHRDKGVVSPPTQRARKTGKKIQTAPILCNLFS